MEHTDRRQFHRIDYKTKAVVVFMDESYDDCQIQNLSLAGMFISGEFKPSLNNKCIIQFVQYVGEMEIQIIEVLGEVVRENVDGIGIQISAMQFDDYKRLVSELVNNADQPLTILEEIPTLCPYEISEERLSIFH